MALTQKKVKEIKKSEKLIKATQKTVEQEASEKLDKVLALLEAVRTEPDKRRKLETMSEELKDSLKSLRPSGSVMRIFVDHFYQVQKMRMAINNQIRAVNQNADQGDMVGVEILEWYADDLAQKEEDFKAILEILTKNHPVTVWLQNVKGIGPALSAILFAYLDIEVAPHAGCFHTYCGLNNNNRKWIGEKGAKDVVKDVLGPDWKGDIPLDKVAEIAVKATFKPDHVFKYGVAKGKNKETGEVEVLLKNGEPYYTKESVRKCISRPQHNKELHKTMYKIGEQFVRSGGADSLYRKVYAKRKAYEIALNEAGAYAEQAAEKVARCNFNSAEQKKIYESGKLPPSHIEMRARRYAVKLFISHLWEAMYIYRYQQQPEAPYVIEWGGHSDYIPPEVPYDDLWK